MVYLAPPGEADRITAYLVTDFTDNELRELKISFEFGACSRFDPLLELKIIRAPEDYLGKSHQYIRARENDADREDAFALIDDEAKERGGIWYIDHFAEEDQVENETAESTDVVFKILIQPVPFALSAVNYRIANMSVEEDLEACGVEFPLKNDFYQPEVLDDRGMDFDEQQRSYSAQITAEPGEFEESTDDQDRDGFLPRPDKVVRLKEEVARSIGVVSSWTWSSKAEPSENDDGTRIEFPPGSVQLQQNYDPDFPWPEYKWPDGSL
ncbi:uncharacterized protein B0J16DRAFT_330284 [Fusarium flagelliforme]|uniref:Uncharacterized protein n=1 Tax=Fusarium flagelliforme TaxID=2675880 RepID=A0A395N538_9HYPO|nr:uncharacterized protein B0J16DRAFT_330284 [Fusarium flagelliforme]KAH7198356.1 hypothetical protein B0J16DRAFT_330284 [Fusarium flagelliforme]RFN55244.1 hypothetical protein FIE12Z_497 [Fusarium flagelliforme]